MKPLRRLSKTSAIALLSLSMFSCIDGTYDLSNLSKEAELFKNSLSAPVGTAKIYMDSIIGGMDVDTSVLKVKNGMYVFGYSGDIELGDLASTFNSFKLADIQPITSTINLYDATNVPYVPFDLPQTEAKDYSGTMSISIPSDFGKNNNIDIDIDSASLVNTKIRISANCTGLEGGNGKTLGDNVSITFTAVGDGADYYVNGITDHWTVPLGGYQDVEIKKIRLTDGSNKLNLSRLVHVSIANVGDIKAKEKIQTSMSLEVKFLNGIDYDQVWGKVNYNLSGQMDPIHFDGLNEIINDNDVFSLYNPTITLTTRGNVGVPVNLNIGMSTTNTRTVPVTKASIKDTTLIMQPAANMNTLKTNTFVLDRKINTGNLFKINPDLINLNYKVQTDATKSSFIAKNTNLSMSYKMEIPLQFGSDLRMSVDTTLENPFKDVTEKLEDQKNLNVAITLNIENMIPLNMKIELEALDENEDSLFTVTTGDIAAAQTTAGLATAATPTTTDINLTASQIDQLKDTKMFKVSFVITAQQNVDFVTVQPSDYILLKIGGKINGGIILDLSSDSNNNKK